VKRAEKAEVIESLKTKADKSKIAVVTDFRGLSVEEMTGLRKKLREQGVDYKVVKNTLAGIALKDGPHDCLSDKLVENCGIAFGYDDPVVPAKLLTDFIKKNKKMKTKFASLDGSYLTDEQIDQLAKLPGREELLGKTLGTMNAVPTNFVCVFANLLRNMLYAMNAIKEQKEQG
jgi:large subunit ribosomal protein L10